MEQLRDYHDPLDKLDDQSYKNDCEDFFHLVSTTAHQGPLTPQDPEYMGSAWNPLSNWEDGSKRRFDKDNGNITWADSDESELKQLFEYEFAKDRRKLAESDPTLKGYTKSCLIILANRLEQANVGVAYLVALTGELNYFKAENEFAHLGNQALAMKGPKSFIDKLKAPPQDGGYGYQIKVKGSNPLAGASAKRVFRVGVPNHTHLSQNPQEWFQNLRPVPLWQDDTAKIPTKGE